MKIVMVMILGIGEIARLPQVITKRIVMVTAEVIAQIVLGKT